MLVEQYVESRKRRHDVISTSTAEAAIREGAPEWADFRKSLSDNCGKPCAKIAHESFFFRSHDTAADSHSDIADDIGRFFADVRCVIRGAAMSPPIPLGFLEAFRTFWVARQPKLRVLMDKVGLIRLSMALKDQPPGTSRPIAQRHYFHPLALDAARSPLRLK
ncbi:hypothetical protein P3C58_32365 [Mesorhizobium sp. XAP10]|uniref:hypothetical protein n=1 Tax=unclassified Mesorhizobium TaxID=325217 RepID=UPI0023E00DCC|nr:MULTISPECIES: hypothetical protein [unclassified Mesorhizobium]MDF3156634.1 hypothetical protein [Mesorhizobium sp. XAP10]MDF3249537.1 hypothetical protein [Mesorhizobium sp. XAP4]